jgi:hypothetical protein
MCCVKLPPVVPLFVLSGLCLISLGCGGLLPGNLPLAAPPNGSAGAISISPQKAALDAGNSLQFTVAPYGPATADLEWLVNGTPGGNSASGTISRSGLYTAPQAVISSTAITVAVVSTTDSRRSGSAEIIVVPGRTPITVSITPSVARLSAGQIQQFTATIVGTTNQGAQWLANDVEGGSSSVGTISSTGLYTAPQVAPKLSSVIITAKSAYDGDSSATAAVTIMPGPVTPPVTSWNPTVLGSNRVPSASTILAQT